MAMEGVWLLYLLGPINIPGGVQNQNFASSAHLCISITFKNKLPALLLAVYFWKSGIGDYRVRLQI